MRWFTLTAGMESVGDSLARSLLPIVAVTVLGAGTATVGVLNALGLAAFLLLSVPIGVLADRWARPTRLMTVSSLVRAGVSAIGVTVWLAGWLDGTVGLVLLVVMALLIGIADVAYTSGQGLLVPRLVGQEQIRAVFGHVQTVSQSGAAAGPAVLTGPLAVLAAPVAWVAPAVLYLGSAVTQRRIHPGTAVTAPPPRTTMWAQARAGAGQLRAQPALARITLANTLNNAAVMTANTLVPVIALRDLALQPSLYAAIGMLSALTGVVAAALAAGLTARVGLRTTRLLTSAAMTSGVALVMLGVVDDVLPGSAVLWLAVQAALASSGTAVAMVAGSDLAPRLVPAEILGTVMGAQRALVLGVMPVAAVTAGALGTLAGMQAGLWLWLSLALASAAPCLRLRPRDA